METAPVNATFPPAPGRLAGLRDRVQRHASGDGLSRMRVLGITVVIEGALLGVALALRGLLDLAHDAPLRFDGTAFAWGVLATAPLFASLVWCARSSLGPVRRLTEQALEAVCALFRDARAVDVAVVALLAGVCEEMAFRGTLQVLLTRWFGFELGWIGASLVFGLVHAVSRGYAIAVFAIGLYLGALMHAFDNLVVPIVAHAVYDFMAIRYLQHLQRRRAREAENPVSEASPAG